MNLMCAAAAVALAATSAGTDVRVWHFPMNEPIHAFAVHPETGDLFEIFGTATPGDFVRRNNDGTFYAVLTLSGETTFDIGAIPGGPEFSGIGRYRYEGSVDVADPENPLNSFGFSGERATFHADSTLTDAGNGRWRLTAQAMIRNGVYHVFDVELVPLD